ncbi:fatty-acid-binding protein 3, chloroplastic isoform X2 [Phoenix dactylifera]|uniref:Chalcone--flavanone isomerase n=1 Tax=Phoenix dactylifera TaxID=42345 RepID=A0A8B8J2R9_PHODC|nr:fatty-acid-binding protein 3, chloroplastic isoform X2 [Phoenix dactylifera]
MLGAVSHPARPPSLVSRCRTKAAPFFVLERRPLLRAFSTFPCLNSLHSPFIPRASVGSSEYVMEPGTNVKFPRELRVPGCSGLLVLLGTGYREKVFAIIGIKVYAAGFYAEPSIRERLDAWKGKPAAEILDDCSLFSSILQDGKTFWNALDDVISPRIKNPTSVDESALLTFRNTFQSRDLKQGTFIFLTWVEPSKMLISISSGGFPSKVDAEIESANVSMALYDAFLGESPVSPTLKTSVANGLTEIFS